LVEYLYIQDFLPYVVARDALDTVNVIVRTFGEVFTFQLLIISTSPILYTLNLLMQIIGAFAEVASLTLIPRYHEIFAIGAFVEVASSGGIRWIWFRVKSYGSSDSGFLQTSLEFTLTRDIMKYIFLYRKRNMI
ncbi:hypothetical protein ACJX0J_017614, partial [Zea mays]